MKQLISLLALILCLSAAKSPAEDNVTTRLKDFYTAYNKVWERHYNDPDKFKEDVNRLEKEYCSKEMNETIAQHREHNGYQFCYLMYNCPTDTSLLDKSLKITNNPDVPLQYIIEYDLDYEVSLKEDKVTHMKLIVSLVNENGVYKINSAGI